jgi:hypothetical protein
MSKSDLGVVIIILLLVLLYLSIWAIGYFIHKLPHFISTLNIAAALAVVGYWAIRQLQVQQHYFELREMIVLGIEVLILVAAIYAIASDNKYKWITTMQYVVFGIHLLLLLLGLVFMFIFKINKLM